MKNISIDKNFKSAKEKNPPSFIPANKSTIHVGRIQITKNYHSVKNYSIKVSGTTHNP